MQAQPTPVGAYVPADSREAVEPQRSGVSWGAIFAGAAAAAALSLILLLLGTGLGLSAVSPWSSSSSTPIATPAILWIAFTQLAASAVGGYMAGRLRVKWVAVHTDEVYFRDTAHGLLAWAVATLLTATLLTGTIRAALSGAIDAGAPVASAITAAGTGAAAGAARDGADNNANPVNYFTDMLLRSDKATADAGADPRAEVARIFATSLHTGNLAADDRAYLAHMVAARTGLPQAEAEKRVDDVYARVSSAVTNAKNAAREAADKARKAAAHSALWMVVGLLLGAFIASMAATFGGKLRDDMPVHRSPI